MKKFLILILMVIMALMSIGAYAETLVVWFSCTGHTQALAKTVAEVLNADMKQIVPAEAYTEDDLNYSESSCRANREQNDFECRPKIVEPIDIKEYDTVILAYPIWWGEEPRIIDTWIESTDLTGKRIAAICTSGSSGIDASYQNLQALENNAIWLGAKRFTAETAGEELSDWFETIGINEGENVEMEVTVGSHVLHVQLENNESALALTELLQNGPITVSANNYGGFEKVCPLGMDLPTNDVYTTTVPGDVMLYAGSNIVLFHGSNSWDYTPVGKITETEGLAEILGGNETEVKFSINQ